MRRMPRDAGTHRAMQRMDLAAQVSPVTGGADALRSYTVGVRRLTNHSITLDLPGDADEVLHFYPELLVELNLPDRAQPHTIACLVRNRAELNGVHVYSCEFDWSATVDPLGVVEDLLEYTLSN